METDIVMVVGKRYLFVRVAGVQQTAIIIKIQKKDTIVIVASKK